MLNIDLNQGEIDKQPRPTAPAWAVAGPAATCMDLCMYTAYTRRTREALHNCSCKMKNRSSYCTVRIGFDVFWI